MNILHRSSLDTKDGIPYFENPEMTENEWVRHAFLTRKGGGSLSPYDSLNLSDKIGDHQEFVFKNRNRVANAFGFDSSHLILLDQMQQDQILILKKPVITLPSPLEYDAVITNSPNRFLGILTADCLPIFVVDQKKSVIAAIHAGRQGTALHITTKVLKKMEEEFFCSPEDLLITLGPSIGPCCYEIDERAFLPEWELFSTPSGRGKWRVNLAGININEMKKEGIPERQIYRVDLCTRCHHDLFFSYRKEGRTGRQLSFIGII
jgi:YfiH family protein